MAVHVRLVHWLLACVVTGPKGFAMKHVAVRVFGVTAVMNSGRIHSVWVEELSQVLLPIPVVLPMVEVLELVLVVVLQIAVDDMILLVDETLLLPSGAMSSTAAQKPG